MNEFIVILIGLLILLVAVIGCVLFMASVAMFFNTLFTIDKDGQYKEILKSFALLMLVLIGTALCGAIAINLVNYQKTFMN